MRLLGPISVLTWPGLRALLLAYAYLDRRTPKALLAKPQFVIVLSRYLSPPSPVGCRR